MNARTRECARSYCLLVTYTIQYYGFRGKALQGRPGRGAIHGVAGRASRPECESACLGEARKAGNFGDAKALRDGVSEMRIDWGPGYRVYFGRDGQTMVILLCGGDKRRQDADIQRAVDLWREYVNRKKSGQQPRH
jgi:putative addiction module killer protein